MFINCGIEKNLCPFYNSDDAHVWIDGSLQKICIRLMLLFGFFLSLEGNYVSQENISLNSPRTSYCGTTREVACFNFGPPTRFIRGFVWNSSFFHNLFDTHKKQCFDEQYFVADVFVTISLGRGRPRILLTKLHGPGECFSRNSLLNNYLLFFSAMSHASG